MNITADQVVTALLLIWVFIYTTSYGTWTWKKKNRLGAVMIYLTAVMTVLLPILAAFINIQE